MYCERNENTERDPFVASEHFGGVVDDKNAQFLTIKNIGLNKGNITFNKVIKRLHENWDKGYRWLPVWNKEAFPSFFDNKKYIPETECWKKFGLY